VLEAVEAGGVEARRDQDLDQKRLLVQVAGHGEDDAHVVDGLLEFAFADVQVGREPHHVGELPHVVEVGQEHAEALGAVVGFEIAAVAESGLAELIEYRLVADQRGPHLFPGKLRRVRAEPLIHLLGVLLGVGVGAGLGEHLAGGDVEECGIAGDLVDQLGEEAVLERRHRSGRGAGGDAVGLDPGPLGARAWVIRRRRVLRRRE
jgi:hypothetical protein